MYKGVHMTSRSGGPCWSSDRGYHQPAPLPSWFMPMVARNARNAQKAPEAEEKAKSQEPTEALKPEFP